MTGLLGAALLAALALRAVPWASGLAAPPTPFTHSATPFLAPGYALLREAETRIPAGASVVVLAEPRDARLESHFYRLGLALLPGREVLPAALYDRFTPPETWAPARYRVVVGGRPGSEGGAPLLETPAGSIWRPATR